MKKRNNNNKRGKQGRPAGPRQPPPLVSNVQYTHTYRFRSVSDATTSLAQLDFCAMAGAVCTVANTTLSFIARMAKVHRISIWTPPASQGATATCSIAYAGLNLGAGLERSDTTISVTQPAHVSWAPPQGSYLENWIISGSDTVCQITAPTGSIIDVHASHILFDTAAAAGTMAVAAGTLGALYYPALDGPEDSYLPVGLQTTT